MYRLYRKGTRYDFQGIKVDSIVVDDDKVEEYKAKGWGCAWDLVIPNAIEANKTEEKFDTIDTNDSGALSVDEVRSAAKEADIDGWDTKRIKTLKKELGV